MRTPLMNLRNDRFRRLLNAGGEAATFEVTENVYTHSLNITAAGGTDLANLPTNSSGDLMVAIVGVNDDHSSIIDELPTGTWTLLRRDKNLAGDDWTVSVWWKYSTGGEATVTVTNNDSTNTRNFSVSVVNITGMAAASPIDATTTYIKAATTLNPDPAAITTVTDGCMILLMSRTTLGGITLAGPPSGYTITSPTDWASFDMPCAWKIEGDAGVKDPGVFTNAGTGTPYNALYTIAIKPA